MWGSILSALLPAIGQLATWLIGLIIKKVGPTPQLVQAKNAVANVIVEEKLRKEILKNNRGSTSSWVAAILAIVVAAAILLFTLKGHADPITTNAGKSSTIAATIAISTTTSAPIDLGAFTMVGINMPAAFTGTTLTFYMSNSISGPWQQVYNASGPVSYTVVAGRYYAMSNITDFQGVRYLEIVSGSSEAAARTLTLSIKTQY